MHSTTASYPATRVLYCAVMTDARKLEIPVGPAGGRGGGWDRTTCHTPRGSAPDFVVTRTNRLGGTP